MLDADLVTRALDAAASGMLLVDGSETIVMANRTAAEMFGYPRETLVGMQIAELLPRRLRTDHAELRAAFVDTPTARDLARRRTVNARRSDGVEFPVEIGLTPIETDAGPFVMSTILDITERVEVEREMQIAMEDLEHRVQELMHFSYSASHDLKAPLTTIQGLARAITEDIDAGDTEEAQRNVGRIAAIARNLGELVEKLLGHALSDRADLRTEVISLREVRSTLLEQFARPAVEAGVELTIEFPEADVHVDATRFMQALVNLVSNGIRFMDAQKDRRFVQVRGQLDAASLVIEVEDNGRGIPTRYHDQVFGTFRRFHPEVKSGSGLGLALVYKHVKRMSGDITFMSSEQGTTFRIAIPRGRG